MRAKTDCLVQYNFVISVCSTIKSINTTIAIT